MFICLGLITGQNFVGIWDGSCGVVLKFWILEALLRDNGLRGSKCPQGFFFFRDERVSV